MKRSIRIVYKRIGDRHGPTGRPSDPNALPRIRFLCDVRRREYAFLSLPRPLYTTDSTEYIRKSCGTPDCDTPVLSPRVRRAVRSVCVVPPKVPLVETIMPLTTNTGRRRKVRCVRIPDDAQKCRQCQERGVACLAQVARQRQTQRFPSRMRITQLETQVSDLTKAVNRIESELQRPRFAGGQPAVGRNVEAGDSEGGSSVGDLIDAEEPSHLRSLFQNHWLSVDMDSHDTRQQQERLAKASAHLLEAARPQLQKLIPSKEEAKDITMHAYDWLVLLELLFPQPFAAKSQRDIMDNYEAISQPNVDIIRLTTWLLEVAITALQISQGPDLPESDCRMMQRKLTFSRSVSETVETTILAHDRLVGTLEGLGMALHFVRL